MAVKLSACAILVTAILGFAYFQYAPPSSSPKFANTQQAEKKNKFDPVTVIKEPFPPITDVTFLDAEKGSVQVSDATLVLGVEVDGISKAYPIPMLCGPDREIINDKFGNRPIAATW